MVQQSGTGRQTNSSSLSPAIRPRSRAYASSMVLVSSAIRDRPPIVPAGWRPARVRILGAVPVPPGPDPPAEGTAAPRRAFLAKVEAILRTLPLEVDIPYGALETAPEGHQRWGPLATVPGLIVRAPHGLPSVDAVAQAVATTVIDEGDAFEAFGGRPT